jgi:hypothetical protein
METETDEESLMNPARGRQKSTYNFLGILVLCCVFFLIGAAWGSSGRAPTSASQGSSTAALVGISGGTEDDDDDMELSSYERGAALVSEDWYPHATDEVVNTAQSEINGTIKIPEDNIMTLYHQTSPEACEGIMNSDFRLGKGGWCGKAIYFAVSPFDTKRKAVAGSSGHGCMLECKVDVGRIKRFYTCGQFDMLTIRGVHRNGADTVLFEPPEKSGDEVIVFEPWRVISKRIIPFNPQWMSHRWHGKPNR